ncbi:MAG: Flp family type IVb pilin [Acidobacteriota bacterium]|nr:Flp family type IVb pilin [Acidobacteriota bacterium]
MLALYRRYLDAKEKIKGLMTDDEGQTVVEYILIIVAISLIILASSPDLVNAIKNVITKITTSLNQQAPAAPSN